MRISKIAIIAMLLGILLVLSACSKAPEQKSKEPVKIGLTLWPGYGYAFIAKEKGFFDKYNVDVELVLIPDASKSYEAYLKGEHDGILDPSTNAITATAEGAPTKIVFIADYSYTGDSIIAKPGINSITDLKGKTVSFEGVNSFSHMFVLKLLEKYGLGEGDVKFENIPVSDVPAALDSGKIDAGHSWQPYTSEALAKGYKIIGNAGDVPGLITDVLALHEKFVNERPEDVKSIVKALLEARDFYYGNQEESLEIMSRATGSSKESIKEGIEGVKQPSLEENIMGMADREDTLSLYHSSRIIGEFYLERGQISRIPDIGSIIEPRFVQEISKEK